MPYLPELGVGELAPVSSPLKWAGGKGQLLAQMQAHFPPAFARYHEPFLGGGAVFFYLVPQRGCRAFISDLNPELMNFYAVLRNETDAFLRAVRQLAEAYQQSSPEERKSMYYLWRNADRAEDFSAWPALKRAVRFYFLNKTAYNGLYRTNQRGYFNVPWGRYKRPSLYRPDVLKSAAEVLRRFIEWMGAASFTIVLEHVQAGDFVYLDPPYVPLSPTSSFTSYTREGFGAEEQAALAAVCRELDRRNVMFLLSNSAVEEVKRLYRGFRQVEVQARRNINSKGDKRGPIPELLVRNY
ncbi:DNA adenine methylase [Candidatus Parcubacteria bacterium]|nr:MAG: DNA adenine methylase [Candidatus Parcubacteria bacterium]